MSKRHSDAIAISQGAVNPAGMARALVSACDECLKENVQQRTDPAVRLITSQIAYIVGIWDGIGDWKLSSFSDASRECNAIIAKETVG